MLLISYISNVVLIEIASFVSFDMKIDIDSYLNNRNLNVHEYYIQITYLGKGACEPTTIDSWLRELSN